MTSHELAKRLLEMPDLPAVTREHDENGDMWFNAIGGLHLERVECYWANEENAIVSRSGEVIVLTRGV